MIQEERHYFCPDCYGQGKKQGKICSSCSGLGTWSVLSSKTIFLDLDISFFAPFLEKIKKLFNFFIIFFLVLFGFLGFLCFLQTIFSFYFLSGPFSFLSQDRLFLMKLFWFSVLSDLFLIYLKKRKKEISLLRISKSKEEKNNLVDYLSLTSKKVIKEATQLAKKLFHKEIEISHLFIGLLQSYEGMTIFSRLVLPWQKVKEEMAKIFRQTPINYEKKELIISREVKKIIFEAAQIAFKNKKRLITPLEILSALVSFDSQIKELLYQLEITSQEIENACCWSDFYQTIKEDWSKLRKGALLRPRGPMNVAMTAVATPFLDQFSQDLTRLASIGCLGPFVDREKECEEIFRILETGSANLVLVGQPGVGKTAIIEGLARKIVQGEVPKIIQDKRLISLSLARLVAGASQPGEIEQRCQIIISEILRAGNIVLFIKDIHNMVGVKTTSGELDISEILAEALEKKYFFLFSTSVAGLYEHYLESSTLGQILTKIKIEEPEKNNTILILEAKVLGIEMKNKVFFSYPALEKAVELSERYLAEKFLPLKAIDLLEEVAVYTRQKRGKGSFVLKEDVAEIVSQKTGIPSEKISQQEMEKLLVLEKKIHQRIINQEEAVNLVASAIRRARTELRDPKKPIVNLLFLGPTGVGKTELAKTVAEIYFGAEEKMIRLDMSEFQTKESLDRLIGCSSEPRGVLTEAVRKSPFSLLLLDEIEKSHPNILNVFLQVMDDGRLTDWQGKTINFTNLIIIGTSNAGTDFIQEELRKEKKIEEIKEILIKEKLSLYFRPEFLNRFDAIVVFKPLGKNELKEITKLLLNKLAQQLEKKGINLLATEQAIEELVEKGFDPVFGARPLRRVIQEEVNNALANYLLTGKLSRGDMVILEPDGKIRVEKKE